MSASWAAVLVGSFALVSGALGTVIGFLIRSARREGKIDAALETLTKIADDHESRLRRGRL